MMRTRRLRIGFMLDWEITERGALRCCDTVECLRLAIRTWGGLMCVVRILWLRAKRANGRRGGLYFHMKNA